MENVFLKGLTPTTDMLLVSSLSPFLEPENEDFTPTQDGAVVKRILKGIVWSEPGAEVSDSMIAFTQGAGVFVAVSAYFSWLDNPMGDGWISISPDARKWTPVFRIENEGWEVGGLSSVAFGHNWFVAVGVHGIYRSSVDHLLISRGIASDGRFQLELQGAAGKEYSIQMTTNLVTWITFKTLTLGESPSLIVDDLELANSPRRFYRAQVTQNSP
ncbi:MAG: hypothetical protein IPK15_13300 [Verrucomicrobia bacterium]|nr:hypothetical protein [Verrucomicrobiota bacterium]